MFELLPASALGLVLLVVSTILRSRGGKIALIVLGLLLLFCPLVLVLYGWYSSGYD